MAKTTMHPADHFAPTIASASITVADMAANPSWQTALINLGITLGVACVNGFFANRAKAKRESEAAILSAQTKPKRRRRVVTEPTPPTP